MSFYDYQPTLLPKDDFDASIDAQVLRSAMKGLGTDEDAIIDVLSSRAGYQRLEIASAYKTQFGRDLIEDVKDELKGNFEDVIVALLTATPQYVASQVHKAISGAGTDEAVLIEIIVPLTNSEMNELKDAYKTLYGTSLEDALKEEASGNLKKLLVSLTNANRDMTIVDIDEAEAAIEAQKIYDAGEGQWGTDESAFLACLAVHSFNHLNSIFNAYQNLSSKSVEESIDSELSGDYKDGLLAIVKCARNTPEFFAGRLYKAMKGLGTDDETLIRIVVTRCELDMKAIKREFEKNFEKSLDDAIADDTSGDYKKILLKLVAD